MLLNDEPRPCSRTRRLRNQYAPCGFKRTSRAASNQRRQFAFCLSPCNVLSCKVPLDSHLTAKGRTPFDDSSHSIDYHGAVGVSPVSATRAVNQPVAPFDATAEFGPIDGITAGFRKSRVLRQRSDENTGSPEGTPPVATPQQPASKSGITAQTDTGQEDTKTEQIIEQEIQANDQEQGPPPPAMNVALGRDEVLIRADQQDKNQDIYSGRGHVEIRFGTSTLHADEVIYDASTGQLTASGHVVFDGGRHNEHLLGSHAIYDISRDSGTFYDVTGSSGIRVKNKVMFLTSSTPFFFTGKIVEKLGPDRYRVHYGFITSCRLPDPKWKWDSQVADIEMGDEVQMHRATLKLHGIPVFYLPYTEHPDGLRAQERLSDTRNRRVQHQGLHFGRCLLLGTEPECRRHSRSLALRFARVGPVWRLPRSRLHLWLSGCILRSHR